MCVALQIHVPYFVTRKGCCLRACGGCDAGGHQHLDDGTPIYISSNRTCPQDMAALQPRIPISHGFPNVTYEPLDRDPKKPMIRLAILQPASREATIRLRFKYTTFAKNPEYEALSYTWGELGVLKAIELNGSCVDIQEDLWLALVSLRDAKKSRVL